ncbi:MAG: DUF1849 family protein [Alphaproteobacteria bacterium]|nr:DUF1849 family protein [Alphaproteobacteria bacterium]
MSGRHKEYEQFLLAMILIAEVIAGLFFFSTYAHAVSDPALKAGFFPHKALYDIRLSSKKSGSLISNISGKMMYEWYSSCDGWVSNYQFDMLYEYIAMPATRVTSDFSTYESFDRQSFNFTVQRKKDGDSYEKFRGATELGEKGYPEKIIYNVPEGLVQSLPEGTLFPLGHTLDVLGKIKQGKRFYSAVLFDGSDGEGPIEVNTFIGREYTYKMPQQALDEDKNVTGKNIDPDLVNTKAWDIRLAFFPLDTSDTVADYEMSVVFHENGVISEMEIEYEDFSVSQNLIAIESVESVCDTELLQNKK